jgi:hypothetical protein
MASEIVQSQQGEVQAHDRGPVPSIIDAMETLKAVRTFVARELKLNVDYGVIPGTGKKATLFLPGAQKIAMYFNTAPEYTVEITELGDGHMEAKVGTRLIHRGTNQLLSSGVGSCSTMEKKYRYRNAEKRCPKCGQGAIIKGKQEYGGGWVCLRNKGGCNAKFPDNAPEIVRQDGGQAENPDIYDSRNTVLKMAKKRSLVDAAHSLGCVSEHFTQDLEENIYDLDEYEAPPPPPAAEKQTNNSGFGRTGMYGSPAQVEAYRKATMEFCADANARWADEWTKHGGMTEPVADVIHPHRMTYHLLKWAIATERLAPVQMTNDPETGKPIEKASIEQAKQFVAVVFARDPEALAIEAEEYFQKLCAEARAKMKDDEEILSTEGGR